MWHEVATRRPGLSGWRLGGFRGLGAAGGGCTRRCLLGLGRFLGLFRLWLDIRENPSRWQAVHVGRHGKGDLRFGGMVWKTQGAANSDPPLRMRRRWGGGVASSGSHESEGRLKATVAIHGAWKAPLRRAYGCSARTWMKSLAGRGSPGRVEMVTSTVSTSPTVPVTDWLALVSLVQVMRSEENQTV